MRALRRRPDALLFLTMARCVLLAEAAVEESLALSLAGVEAAKDHIHKLLEERAAAANAEIAALKAERDAALAKLGLAEARALRAEQLQAQAESEVVQVREEMRSFRIAHMASTAAAQARDQGDSLAARASDKGVAGDGGELDQESLAALLAAKSKLLEEALICVTECQQLVLACRHNRTEPTSVPRVGHARSAREEFKRIYAALSPAEQALLFSKVPLSGPVAPAASPVLSHHASMLAASASRLHGTSTSSAAGSDEALQLAAGRDPRFMLWWQFGEPPAVVRSTGASASLK